MADKIEIAFDQAIYMQTALRFMETAPEGHFSIYPETLSSWDAAYKLVTKTGSIRSAQNYVERQINLHRYA